MTVYKKNTIVENSDSGGLVMVTIPNPAADTTPNAKIVKSCLVRHFSGTGTYVNINSAAVAATSWPLTANPLPIPVTDLSMLHFIGTAGDKVLIMWRA